MGVAEKGFRPKVPGLSSVEGNTPHGENSVEEGVTELTAAEEIGGLEEAFGTLTDEQFRIARADGGFLVALPPKAAGEPKQAVAFEFMPLKTNDVITGWQVVEIAGADAHDFSLSGASVLGIKFSEELSLDLTSQNGDTSALKRGLDEFIRVAGDQASPLTKEMYNLKEAAQDKKVFEKKFKVGTLTDEQFRLAKADGGFLVSVPLKKVGEQRQVVAFRFEPVKTNGATTGWKVAEIAGSADLGVYVDDVLKLDLYSSRSGDAPALKSGLDEFMKVAGDQASPLTKEIYNLKEAAQAKYQEYKKADGFEAYVKGGKVKLKFGENSKREQTVTVTGVTGNTKYTKNASYIMKNLPQELQSVVQAELAKTRKSGAVA